MNTITRHKKYSKATTDEFRRLRNKGWAGEQALHAAKVWRRFARLEALGLVRLECKPDECADLANLEGDCFDPRHNPTVQRSKLEAERKAFHERIERDGVWGLVGEYKQVRGYDDSRWVHADSCWGFVGDDVKDNGYDTDIKAQTIDALRTHIRERCRCCSGTGKKVQP